MTVLRRCACVCVCMYIYMQMNGYRIYIYMYIHKMQYYSIIKKNKIMPFAATWMDLEVTVLK